MIDVFDGPVGKTILKSGKRDPFERATADEFSITCRSLGRLKELVIGHDNVGLAAAWHLERVDITDVATGVVSPNAPMLCCWMPSPLTMA